MVEHRIRGWHPRRRNLVLASHIRLGCLRILRTAYRSIRREPKLLRTFWNLSCLDTKCGIIRNIWARAKRIDDGTRFATQDTAFERL